MLSSTHVAASLRDAIPNLGEARPREWDPFTFVDQCEVALQGRSNDQATCLELQQIEWESLFDYCYRAAIGK